jgi:membrane protein DedA with SNARE-associated domain
MTDLSGLLTWPEHLVGSAGFLGLGVVMAAEAVLPIPSEVVLPIVGARVSSGELTLLLAVVVTTVGSVLGSTGVYALARWGGRPRVQRLTRLLGITDERWVRVESWFARHGALVVLLGRLVPGVRCVVALPAGSLRMPLPRFLALTAIGSAGWNAAWIGGGAWLTAHWSSLLAGSIAAVSAAQPALVSSAAAGAVLVLVREMAARAIALHRISS